MKWISVDQDLPKQNIVVLVYQTFPRDTMFNLRADPHPRSFFKLAVYRDWDKNFIDYDGHWIPCISHWMPLPEKPGT